MSRLRFLSTPSARRATLQKQGYKRRMVISIHALCEEGDRRIGWRSPPTAQFLSTPSARRATSWSLMPSSESFNFYPRPPRGERRGRPSGRTLKKPFLSTPSARRATCGALRRGLAAALFLSTPSARRATLGANGKPRPWKISIHALREEGDLL